MDSRLSILPTNFLLLCDLIVLFYFCTLWIIIQDVYSCIVTFIYFSFSFSLGFLAYFLCLYVVLSPSYYIWFLFWMPYLNFWKSMSIILFQQANSFYALDFPFPLDYSFHFFLLIGNYFLVCWLHYRRTSTIGWCSPPTEWWEIIRVIVSRWPGRCRPF